MRIEIAFVSIGNCVSDPAGQVNIGCFDRNLPACLVYARGPLQRLEALVAAAPVTAFKGATWTTDAPYRETEEAIAAHRDADILAVEMEAAALYAFSCARGHPVACFAHVTNTMAQTPGDFEKGEANGALDSLSLATAAAKAWLS